MFKSFYIPEPPEIDADELLEIQVQVGRDDDHTAIYEIQIVDHDHEKSHKVATVRATDDLKPGSPYRVTVNWVAWGENDPVNAGLFATALRFAASFADQLKAHVRLMGGTAL